MKHETNASKEEANWLVNQQIKVGHFIEIAGRVLEIFSITEHDHITLRDVQQGEHRTISREQLTQLLNEVDIRPVDVMPKLPASHQHADATNAPWLPPEEVGAGEANIKALKVMNEKMTWTKELRKRLTSLRPTEEAKRMLKEIERQRGEKSPFTVGTLYRASLSLIKAGGVARALRPLYERRGGRGQSRLDPKVESILKQELEKVKLNPKGRLKVSKICQTVENEMRTSYPDVSTPSRPTIERRMHNMFSEYEWLVRIKGKAAAEAKFRNTHGRIRADAPLSVVQFDDTDTRVFLVSEHNGLPWGRAWLTAGVDEFTKAVVGLEISEQPRNTESAYRTYMNAVMPLNFSKPEFELVKSRTDYYGHIGLAIMDNAMYNHATALEACIRDMGSEIMYTKPRTPTEKPDIEYFNKKLKEELVPDLPGSLIGVDRLAQMKGAEDGAVLTVSNFRKLLMKWVYDDYSHVPQANGYSPHEMWTEWFKDFSPQLPRNLPSLEVRMGIPQHLKFRSSGGILRLGLRYNSANLNDIRRKCIGNNEVEIRYNPNDLTYIWVLNPDINTYLKVPCIESLDFTVGLSNNQLKLIRKLCVEKKIKSPTLSQLMAARAEMVIAVKQMLESAKIARRKKGNANAGDLGNQKSTDRAAERKVDSVKSALKVSTVELWTDDIDKHRDEEAEEEGWV